MEEIKRAWEAAGNQGTGGVFDKLARMHEHLHVWDSKVLRKPKHRLRKAPSKQ